MKIDKIIKKIKNILKTLKNNYKKYIKEPIQVTQILKTIKQSNRMIIIMKIHIIVII